MSKKKPEVINELVDIMNAIKKECSFVDLNSDDPYKNARFLTYEMNRIVLKFRRDTVNLKD